MPTPRVAMRKIKECLRLKLECGLSNDQVARALGLSKGVVGKYVGRARVCGLDWATLSGLDERCQGFDVVVSLNGPGGVLLAEMTSAVEATRMRVAVPVGTPVAAEQLTGVSVVLRGNGA